MDEAYACHGSMVEGGGPIRYVHESVLGSNKLQPTVGESSFGISREEAYQLALDFTTLFEPRINLDPSSLCASEIDEGLKDVTSHINFEQSDPDMLKTINQGRERLRDFLDCKMAQ